MAAVLPDFEPQEAPGAWIDRAQQRGALAQQQDEERQKFQILKPVLQARAQADQATALAGLATAHRMEQMRQQAAIAAPQALDEFLEATKIPVVADRAAALDALSGKYAWLGNLPENKQFMATLADERGKAHLENLTSLKLDEAQQIARDRLQSLERVASERSDLQRQVQESRADTAKIVQQSKADTATAVQAAKAESAVELQAARAEMEKMKQENANLRASIRGESTTTAAETRAGGTVEAAKIRANAPSKRDKLLQEITGGTAVVPGEKNTPAAPASDPDEGWVDVKLPSGTTIKVRKKP